MFILCFKVAAVCVCTHVVQEKTSVKIIFFPHSISSVTPNRYQGNFHITQVPVNGL